MNKNIEKILYNTGINISAYNIDRELNYLERNLPSTHTNRNVVDIGCGDGKTSLKLIPIIKPKSFTGVDVSNQLIKTAKKRGIDASVLDIETQELKGDLGIMWGVLHHLSNPVKTLKKLKNNFNNLIIRESINEKRLIEVGNKLSQKKLLKTLERAEIKIAKIIEIKTNKSLIILTK